MNIEPTQGRKCEICQKQISLNLFRQNGSTCRYCESGGVPPSYVIRNNEAKTNNQVNKSEKELQAKTMPSEQNSIEDNINIEEEAKNLYDKMLFELTILLGSIIRWNDNIIDTEKIVGCLEQNSRFQEYFLRIDDINRNKVISALVILIKDTYVDATMIKASFRTLLRSPNERRLDLITLLESYFKDNSNLNKISAELKSDLIKDADELDYPIPIMPPVSKQEIDKNKESIDFIIEISFRESMRVLTTNLNSKDLVISKQEFEAKIKEEIRSNYRNFNINIEITSFIKAINQGINIAYKYYGLDNKQAIYIDSSGNELIDLKASNCG